MHIVASVLSLKHAWATGADTGLGDPLLARTALFGEPLTDLPSLEHLHTVWLPRPCQHILITRQLMSVCQADLGYQFFQQYLRELPGGLQSRLQALLEIRLWGLPKVNGSEGMTLFSHMTFFLELISYFDSSAEHPLGYSVSDNKNVDNVTSASPLLEKVGIWVNLQFRYALFQQQPANNLPDFAQN